MSITAIVEGNNIKLPPGTNLPDGTKVRIELPTEGHTGDDLLALAGSWQEDPAFDLAVQAFGRVDASVWQ